MAYEYKVPRTPPNGSANVVSGTDTDNIARALLTDASGRLEVVVGAAGAAASPNKVEDTAAATGDTGVAVMAVQRATPSDLATENDYAFAQMSGGMLWTQLGGAVAGAVTETAPASDTASSGLNGRLQRIAQRITSLITGGFTGPATSTPFTVASVTTAGGVTISAGAAANRGRTITNTDANQLFLYFGANGTVSSSVYHVALLAGEVLILSPGEYTGHISGIWAADGSGSAFGTEFTA